MQNTAEALGRDKPAESSLKTLPGDDVRQIMWRFSDRYDLQMTVQSARAVARGVVARLVADGERHSHEWTEGKKSLFDAYDGSGITAVAMDPAHGGYIEGPKNLAMGLVAFELAWVDAGAATSSLATNLALAPIHERGTKEQREHYMMKCSPSLQNGKPWRGAFALTEPLPYIGVDTGVVGGRVRVAEWKDGQEPMLQIEKRGRFITNMAFANFVTAAVTSDDPKIKGSCMVILEETDPGTFDRGAPTLKLVHQLSSTQDPIFSLKVPASRIIGGYTIKDGVIVPNYSHGDVIESVFLRTRVTPGLMSAAKLLSAVEPVIRYQRQRFQGGDASTPGTPRYELGLQQKEDALLRLVDIWSTGEAASSLGFSAARLLDEFEPIEKQKEAHMAAQKISGGRAEMKVISAAEKKAIELLKAGTDITQADELMVKFAAYNALANVYVPACKLWNTSQATAMMREALSLMGGYGITEDCPGFLAYKWMDAQLEATYEGPEAVQRRQLSVTMTNELFLAQMDTWISELRRIANDKPGTGACALATAFGLWKWTLKHLLGASDADGKALYHGKRQGVSFGLADALAWLVAARSMILDVVELEQRGAENPSLAEGLPGFVAFFTDLCHNQVARAAGEAGRIAAELVYGYNRHPSWDGAPDSCLTGDALDQLESIVPGFGGSAPAALNRKETDGSHPIKSGPCVRFPGADQFNTLRVKLDGCLTGARLAKDRAANRLTQVMIPAALDYPV